MGVSDELLLKLIYQEENQKAMSEAEVAFEKLSDAEKKYMKSVAESTDASQKQMDALNAENEKARESAKGHDLLKGSLVELKAGFDLIGDAMQIAGNLYNQLLGETMQYNKSVRDLAQNLNITTEETSRIIQTADDFTVSQEAVTSALQMAVKKGMAPSIDTLAKMADEYNSIADPTERAARLTEVFGRNWTALTPMLKEGGAAIREAAASQDDALIVTEAQSKATRELEKSLDNLGDKVTALKLKVGNTLIPQLVATGDQLMRDIAFLDGTATKADELQSAVVILSRYYGENSVEAKAARDALQQYQVTATQTNAALQFMNPIINSTNNLIRLTSQYTSDAARAASAANSELSNGLRALAESQQVGGSAQQEFQAWLAKEKQVADEASKAEIAHRQAIGDSIVTIDSLAQSLAKATDAQAKQMLAQAGIDAIIKAQKDGRISAEEAAKATETLMINSGLATQKSIDMAKAQKGITDAMLDGRLPMDSYIISLEKIPKLASDGSLSMNDLATLGIGPGDQAAKDANISFDYMGKKALPEIERAAHRTETANQTMSQSMDDSVIAMLKAYDQAGIYKHQLDLLADRIASMPTYSPGNVGGTPVAPSQLPSNTRPSGKAYGGPVSAGMPYMVGERGPEMFVPAQNGTIVPNQVNNYSTQYNITTDRTGLAYMFERQRMAEARM